MTAATIAVTGATGFLGRHVVAALVARGFRVRVLARRDPIHPLWQSFTPDVVLGSLADGRALRRLVDGADGVIHLAGLIKAESDVAFLRANRDGSGALAAAVAEVAPRAHLVHVSSLAARHPHLSGYAASKLAGEQAVQSLLPLHQLSILRPPAIYGPGDRETLAFFRLASLRVIPLPGRPRARLTLIHVDDAARLIADRVTAVPSGRVEAFCDARPAGYLWREVLHAAAAAVGNQTPRFVSVPAAVVRSAGIMAGGVASLLRKPGMVTSGKVQELLHEDWSLTESELLQDSASPSRQELHRGFASTAMWYRQAGWL